MRLKIMLPNEIFLDTEINQVTAESPRGEFSLKPRHIDYVTSLVPGILIYRTGSGREHFIAVDTGILVKQQQDVMVATRHAVSGELGELTGVVRKMQEKVDEREKVGRSAAARLEIGFYKRFLELNV